MDFADGHLIQVVLSLALIAWGSVALARDRSDALGLPLVSAGLYLVLLLGVAPAWVEAERISAQAPAAGSAPLSAPASAATVAVSAALLLAGFRARFHRHREVPRT